MQIIIIELNQAWYYLSLIQYCFTKQTASTQVIDLFHFWDSGFLYVSNVNIPVLESPWKNKSNFVIYLQKSSP